MIRRRTPAPRRALLACSVDVTLHYRGPVHLAQDLARRGWKVRVVAPIGSPERAAGLSGLDVSDMKAGRIGSHRGLRRLWWTARVFAMALRSDLAVAVEPGFSGVCAVARMLRPRLVFVQSCGEMYEPSEGHSRLERSMLDWSVRRWSAFVDVNEERRQERHRRTGFSGPSWVIPNTLPVVASERRDAPRRTTPVLAYVGNVAPNVDVEGLGTALALVGQPFHLVAWIHGGSDDIDRARHALLERLGPGVVDIRPPVGVGELHRRLEQEADIGLVHYPISAGAGVAQRLCAPGKVFDYMRAGLPFVGTSNPPMIALARGGAGVTAVADTPQAFAEALSQAIRTWASGAIDRHRIRAQFETVWSTEAVVPAVACAVVDLVERTSSTVRRSQPMTSA